MGASVGPWVGLIVGLCDGLFDGKVVGCGIGSDATGAIVGDTVGTEVGLADGAFVCPCVGLFVGSREGSCVGDPMIVRFTNPTTISTLVLLSPSVPSSLLSAGASPLGPRRRFVRDKNSRNRPRTNDLRTGNPHNNARDEHTRNIRTRFETDRGIEE